MHKKSPTQLSTCLTKKLGRWKLPRSWVFPAELVYKTIVVTREGRKKPILAVIPGPKEVDLKALAKSLNEKKVMLPTQREAERLTGLLAGGISPLALIHKGFEVVIDDSARSLEGIFISGGQRGLNIRLPVDALASLTNATFLAIAR